MKNQTTQLAGERTQSHKYQSPELGFRCALCGEGLDHSNHITNRAQPTLKDFIGREVTVQNVANVDMENGKLQFKLEGVLEAPVDDDPNYFLRVKECYNGTSGISFNERHLAAEDGIYKQPSGRIEITLK